MTLTRTNTALFSLLDQTTHPDVLRFDKEVSATQDKHALFALFETSETAPPKRDTALLERWTHYRWIRLELLYLMHQQAALTHITSIDDAREKLRLDTIDRAIQEDTERNLSISDSIRILQEITLQVISTEHPTDPLSQSARNLLLETAQALNERKLDETKIKGLLEKLQTKDAIPPSKRSVEDEVNRNIDIALQKLYDSIPAFIDAIIAAYKKHYGEEVYRAHEDELFQTIEKSLFRHGSWAGFDADGNSNVTAATMKNAIRLHRIRIAEKHKTALETSAVETTKKIERDIREQINRLNLSALSLLKESANIYTIYEHFNKASQFLIDRKFSDLIKHYEQMIAYFRDSQLSEDIIAIADKQITLAKLLVQLTKFSGVNNVEVSLPHAGDDSPKTQYAHQQGDLQSFQQTLLKYKDAIRDNSDAIDIEDKPASQFMIEQFHQLMARHRDLLNEYPDLYRQMRCFGVQLQCFGMTYGVGHVRQDSSVYDQVWNAILTDFNTELPQLNGRSYLFLNQEERLALHKQLQDGSENSKKILSTIYNKFKKSHYSSEEKYKKPTFDCVRTELERVDLALKNNDMIEDIIISNSENAAHLLSVESLLAIFPKRPGQQVPRVVPLLEKREDLERYKEILNDYMVMKAATKVIAMDSAVKPRNDGDLTLPTVEVMVGFSDTERVSGIPALISIQKVKEDLIHLAKECGVKIKFYHGPGGDPNRGGLKRRDEKATLQGNARSNVLNSTKSTLWFLENLFYHAHALHAEPDKRLEFTQLSEHLQDMLSTFTNAGVNFYEFLHDTKSGLGKLTSLMLGQGGQWMVTILNSSSRATQRGTADSTGDRTASVQSGGLRPEAYVQLDKLRAITATQAKEVLRDNLDFVGAGHGLRTIGQAQAERLYDTSETFRDMVEKTLLGEATRDLSFLAHTLFADHPELLPSSLAQMAEWANECRTNFPTLLKTMNIEAMSKVPQKRSELLVMLSRLFAYLQEESQLTREFLFKMNRSIHLSDAVEKNPGRNFSQPLDLLFHAPALQQQMRALISEVEPLSYLFARQSHHVANGKNLDQVYAGLNEQTVPNSLLSGIGRLIANIGSALTAFRQTQPGFTENLFHDYRSNLRMGVTRAEAEKKLHPAKFFTQTKTEVATKIQECFRKRSLQS